MQLGDHTRQRAAQAQSHHGVRIVLRRHALSTGQLLLGELSLTLAERFASICAAASPRFSVRNIRRSTTRPVPTSRVVRTGLKRTHPSVAPVDTATHDPPLDRHRIRARGSTRSAMGACGGLDFKRVTW